MPRPLIAAAVVLAALLSASPASAETHPEEALAFGWLVEHADAVVVATLAADAPASEAHLRELTLEVEASIRGPLELGARPTILVEDRGERLPYALGETHLAFLRALERGEGEPAGWTLLSGPFGLRPVPAAGPEARFPGFCQDIAAALGDPTRYRALLVEALEDEDPGMAWSAATDLVRHAEMHAALTATERNRIVAAFERQPIGKATKKALALAAAATGEASAATALVRCLLEPRAEEVRLDVGEALRRLEHADTVRLLLQALDRATPGQAANLLNAVGTLAPPSATAADAVRRRVLDPLPVVRIEAAHALGLVTREVRRASPLARLGGWEDLLLLLDRAGTENEQRAALWALAQFDEEEAYEALRALVASEDRSPLVREAAARYLANPRLSLVLR